MIFRIYEFDSHKEIEVDIGKQKSEGSNSKVFEAEIKDETRSLVAKCSKNAENFVSFNLQYNAFLACKNFELYNILIPKVICYGKSKEIGEILLLEKMDNIYDIPFIINNGLFYGEIILKKIAEAVARLHNIGISGYDVEFYWKADTNQLVLLDVGPQYTFDVSEKEMIVNHFLLEHDNFMGKWNLLSQIVPPDMAKSFYKGLSTFSVNDIMPFLKDGALDRHICNTAKVHALSVISRLSLSKQNYYLELFVREYKKQRVLDSINSARYLKSFREAVINREQKAKACLYYSKVETLCEESCSIEIERKL